MCSCIEGKHDPITLSREAEYPLNGVIPDPGIYAYDCITMPESTTDSYRRGRPNTAFVMSNGSVYSHVESLNNNSNGHHNQHTNYHQSPRQSANHTQENGYQHKQSIGENYGAEVEVNGNDHHMMELGASAGSRMDFLQTPPIPNTSQR